MNTAPRSHRRTALLAGGLALGMFAFGFALAPFYSQICAALGIQVADAPQVRKLAPLGPPAADPVVRPVTVRFDTTVNANLPWEFEPVTRRLDLETGSRHTATFRARNLSDRPQTGRAVVSVTPWQATPYVDKTECFCFQEQPLEPGAEAELTLRFVVLPDLPLEYRNLTLSYTFMNIDPDAVAQPRGHAEALQRDRQGHGTAHEPATRHAG